jgi:predicted RNA binding protein YcfA (HicA-like mRNA interferase family)
LGRLRVLSGQEVLSILSAHGFVVVRQRGSHAVAQRRLGVGTVTAIVPLHREIRPGTLLSIVRQSGLPRALFEES